LLTFALDASAELPRPRALTHAVASPLPELDVAPADVARGAALFNTYCLPCHGILAMTSGVVPDLRFASLEVHAQFQQIVLGGSRSHMGMVSFADALSVDQARWVHAYVLERAREVEPGSTD
jgi:mono/diheme cytochrome c family protein